MDQVEQQTKPSFFESLPEHIQADIVHELRSVYEASKRFTGDCPVDASALSEQHVLNIESEPYTIEHHIGWHEAKERLENLPLYIRADVISTSQENG